MSSSREIHQLINLGPKSRRALAAVGIRTECELRSIGVIDAYQRPKHANPKTTSLLMLYAMQGALMDIHWNQLPMEIKDDLRAQVEII